MLEIRAYDPRWADDFERERERLDSALGMLTVRIDHSGSTSVPGLASKPIIDIQVSVRELQPLDVYVRPLLELGYFHVPHADDAFAPFFHRPAAWPHTHHIHLVAAGGDEERRTLAFRDYLREHDAVARAYEALKRRLASQYSEEIDEREAYAVAKGEFIAEITARALAEGYPCW